MATYGNPPRPITPVPVGTRVVGKDRQAYLSRMLARGNLSDAHKTRVLEELWGQGQFSWQPPTPQQLPFGTYDVGLDAQLRAAQRGAGYSTEDLGTQLARLKEDFASGQEEIATGRTRNTEDFTRNTQVLDRSYAQLRQGQLQNMRRANASGGAYQQSQEKRAANREFDFQPIQTGYQRGEQDLSRALAGLTRDYQRGDVDLNTQLRRVQSELPAFEYDIGQAKLAQARQYDPGLFNRPAPNNTVPKKKNRKKGRR